MRRRKSYPKFHQLPRNKRADMVFALKHKIADGLYDTFDTHHYLDEGGLSWIDVNFVGNDKFTLWNCTLHSAPYVINESKKRFAFDKAYGALTPEQLAARDAFNMFGPRKANGTRQMLFDRTTYEQFDGRDLYEEIRHQEALAPTPVVKPTIKVLRNYSYGIGLDGTLDVGMLTTANITQWIEDFLKLGLTDKDQGKIIEGDTPMQNIQGPVYSSNAINM